MQPFDQLQSQSSGVIKAYLSARQRQSVGPINVTVVVDSAGHEVDYGLPCDWKGGTAMKVSVREGRGSLVRD